MLVLSRNKTQSIIIGDEVEVTILGVQGNQVRIGIKAPDDVPVHREEIHEKIKKIATEPEY